MDSAKSLVIVALPSEDDYVNKISSETVPHMTLLFLGEADKVKNLDQIVKYVEHAASVSLKRFGLEVDHRGVLGPESADVLFFSKAKWSGIKCVADFRSYLLKDPNIKTAFDSAEQFPEWIPHLTLGFPETPANEDQRDYPGITYVRFDRIAVWFQQDSGVEFPLKKEDWDMEVAMSGTKEIVKNILEHHGVKGQRWGVRRDRSSAVTVRDRRKKIKTSGGHGLPAHMEAIRAREIGQKGKASGFKSLSDAELKVYANRLQLEQNAKRLHFNEKSAPAKFVAKILGQQGNALASEGLSKGTKAAGKRALQLAF